MFSSGKQEVGLFTNWGSFLLFSSPQYRIAGVFFGHMSFSIHQQLRDSGLAEKAIGMGKVVFRHISVTGEFLSKHGAHDRVIPGKRSSGGVWHSSS